MKTVGTTPPARGELRCERLADDTLLVHLVGHWTIHAGAPVVTEVYQQLDASPPVRRLAFEAQELTAWDSRLLTLLRQVHGGEHAPADRRRSAGPAGGHPPPPGAGRRRARARRRPARGRPALLARQHRDRGARRLAGRLGYAGLHWRGRPRRPPAGDRPGPLPAGRSGPLRARKRRAGPGHCHPHQLSHWPDPGLYGGRAVAPVWGADLRRRPGGVGHDTRDGLRDDGHHHGRAHRRSVCGATGHHASQ